MDTMTHPDYRNRGLFITLANMTYDYVLEKEGSAMFIGIPGSNSFYGFVKKLNWKNKINIRYVFSNTLYIRLRLCLSNDKSISINKISEFDSTINELFTLNNSSLLVSKNINSEILNWKFTSNPINNFDKYIIKKDSKKIGVSIIEINKNKIKIVLYKDLDPSGCTQKFFLKELSKRFPNHLLYTWESNGNLIHNSNKKLFFMNPFSKGLFSYRVPFITLIKGKVKYDDIIKNIANFDLYPGIQD
jgi:hypothetical protein